MKSDVEKWLPSLAVMLSCLFAQAAEFIELRSGESSAAIATSGARVISFRCRGNEVLWQPAEWLLPGGKGSHGGIFICWPWFGADGPKSHARHGFAREQAFTVREKEDNRLILGLVANDRTRKIFPYEFDLELGFLLTSRLSVSVRTRNTGKVPFDFGGGFHPYLAVGNRDDAVVRGLPWEGDFRVTAACDRLFSGKGAPGSYEIVDAVLSRRIVLMPRGTNRVIVWNPGRIGDDAKKPGAIGPDGWRHFVCVEPALMGDGKVHLEPGESHLISLEVGALPL